MGLCGKWVVYTLCFPLAHAPKVSSDSRVLDATEPCLRRTIHESWHQYTLPLSHSQEPHVDLFIRGE